MTGRIRIIRVLRKFGFFFLLAGFYACDSYNYIDYNLVNSASSPVEVTFNQWGFLDAMYVGSDSTFILAPGEVQTLTVRSIIGSAVWDAEAGNDSVWMFPKFIVLKGAVPPNDNLKKIKYWSYDYLSRHHAKFTLTLFDKYFQ